MVDAEFAFRFPFGALEFTYSDGNEKATIQLGCSETAFAVRFRTGRWRHWSPWHGSVATIGKYGFFIRFHCAGDESKLVCLPFSHFANNAFWATNRNRTIVIVYTRWVTGPGMRHSSNHRKMITDPFSEWLLV